MGNLGSGNVWRVGVVRRNVALLRVAKVHAGNAGFVQLILERLVQLLCIGADLCKLGETLLGNARNDLAVTKGAEVAGVAEKLSGVVQELLEVFIGDAGLGLDLFPVT